MSKKVIGSAEFGAFMHRNNGGKVNISAYTAVNKPLKVDAADETECIARRKYSIVEDERPELEGNKFYSKSVWNEQTESGKKDYSDKTPVGNREYYDNEQEEKPDNKELTPLQVLKNFVDKIQDQIIQMKTEKAIMWVMLVLLGAVAACALGVAILALP